MADTPAFRCPICWELGDDDPMPAWAILRHGDAAASWACHGHLGLVLEDMLRVGHKNEFTVLRREG